MKKFILVLMVSFLMVGCGQSESTTEPAEKLDVMEICTQVGNLAEVVMLKRQEGIDINTMFETSDNELAHGLIQDAYKRPRFHGEDMQMRSISDFKSEVVVMCLDKLK